MKTNREQWQEIYAAGHEQNAPWDEVISFIYKFKPPGMNAAVKVMEVGCGTGSNIRFLERQGFVTSGIDQDAEAIRKAQVKYWNEHLIHDLKIGDFKTLPWLDDQFDMVIDRGSLGYAEGEDLKAAIAEIHRVLKPGGKLLFTPYDVTGDWRKPFNLFTLRDYAPDSQWSILAMTKQETTDLMGTNKVTTSHYQIVLEKAG